MKKLLCFDVDGTITEKRTGINRENYDLLEVLSKKYKLLIVSSGSCERIYAQLNCFPVEILGNFGMEHSVVDNGVFKVIERTTVSVDKKSFLSRADYVRKTYGYTDYKGESVEFHATGMVTFPLLGTGAEVKDKLAFDPTREKRLKIYGEVKKLFSEFQVYIGGSSSFDFSDAKFNKLTAICHYAEKYGYKKEEILFFGDEFEEGGGDYPVFSSDIDTIKIRNYRDLKNQTRFLL